MPGLQQKGGFICVESVQLPSFDVYKLYGPIENIVLHKPVFEQKLKILPFSINRVLNRMK